ncbi:MAG: hypothetical protein NVS3B12_28680 [Acidimicrobiales bacterium]
MAHRQAASEEGTATQWAWRIDQEGTAVPIGERIKQLRTELGWSQAELGKKVGTDSQRISRYENGRLNPSVAAVVRLAEALNVSVDYLVVEGAPRRPLQGPDLDLGERLADLGQLDEDDRSAVLRIVEGLLAKNRVKAALTTAKS